MESFVWGVKALLTPKDFSQNNLYEKISNILKSLDFVNSGDYIVFVAGLSAQKFMPGNIIKVHKIL